MQVEQLVATNDEIQTLKDQLNVLRQENQRLTSEMQVLRSQKVLIIADAEAQEERTTNLLLRKLNALKHERDKLAMEVEREEDYLTNTLLKKYNFVLRENMKLENRLEKEEEYIFNKLQKRHDTILSKNFFEFYELEKEKISKDAALDRINLLQYLERKYEKFQVQNIFHSGKLLSGILYRQTEYDGSIRDKSQVQNHCYSGCTGKISFSLPNIPLKNNLYLSNPACDVVLKEGWMYYKFGFLENRARFLPSLFFVLLGNGLLVAYNKQFKIFASHHFVFQLDLKKLISCNSNANGEILLELQDQSIWIRPFDNELDAWMDFFEIFSDKENATFSSY